MVEKKEAKLLNQVSEEPDDSEREALLQEASDIILNLQLEFARISVKPKIVFED